MSGWPRPEDLHAAFRAVGPRAMPGTDGVSGAALMLLSASRSHWIAAPETKMLPSSA